MTYEASLSALTDPTRRAILERLREGPMAVGDIARDLPVSRAAVSQHLRVLKEAALVSEWPEGTRRIYQVEREGLEELHRYLQEFWGDILGAYVSRAGEGKRRGRKKRTKP